MSRPRDLYANLHFYEHNYLRRNLLYPLSICNERFKNLDISHISSRRTRFVHFYFFKSLMNLPKTRGLLTSHRVYRVLFHSNRASSFAPPPPDGDTYTRPRILHGGAIRKFVTLKN